MRFGCLISLRSEIGGSRPALREEAREHWLDEGAEDDLSATIPCIQLYAGTVIGIGRERLTQSEGEPSTRQGRI